MNGDWVGSVPESNNTLRTREAKSGGELGEEADAIGVSLLGTGFPSEDELCV